jgi:hypothetical protein
MRSGLILNRAFWGAVLIVVGSLMVVNVIFHINIPISKIIFALILIFFGVRVLMGRNCCTTSSSCCTGNKAIFSEAKLNTVPLAKEYSVVFSSGQIDLSTISPIVETTKVSVNTVFGATVIKINPDIPARFTIDCAFASAKTPNAQQTSFGSHFYQTPAYKEGEPYLWVEADVVFGSLEII